MLIVGVNAVDGFKVKFFGDNEACSAQVGSTAYYSHAIADAG